MKVDRQRFLTGIPLIDNQHMAYVDLVDRLFVLCGETHVDKSVVNDAIGEVFAYAIEHFDAEEALMRSINYPGHETHRTKHDEFRVEIDRVSESRHEGIGVEDQLIHLTKWLLDWFIEQTQTYDVSLASHLKRHGHISPNNRPQASR
jgi:hemerythrin